MTTLLSIRQRRLHKQEGLLVAAKNAHEKALKQRTEQKHQLATWKKTIPIKENQFFLELKGRNVQKKDVEDMRLKIGRLRDHENTLAERYQKAVEHHKNMQEQLLEQQKRYQQAQKDKEKISQAQQQLQKQENIMQQRKEDDALDEIATARR